MIRRSGGMAAVIAVTLFAPAATESVASTEAAERQYRVARRLAAEGSAEAPAALKKVVELDPSGPLADDAMLEHAKLHALARWPEQLGRLDSISAQRARALIGKILKDLPDADRVPEARYFQALLRLEPLTGYDEPAARVDLISAATAGAPMEWSPSARYVLAWLDEQSGRTDRAGDGYQRLMIDAPGTDSATRARVGLARLHLREGNFGPAARLLDQAIDHGAPDGTGAAALKELAVRGLLRSVDSAAATQRPEIAVSSGVRALAGMAATGDGGVLLGDRRSAGVLQLDNDGQPGDRWNLDDLQAVTVDPLGRAFAAAGESVYRLDRGSEWIAVSSQGEFGPVSALAADGNGRFWLLDKRGRIGTIAPGATEPRQVWDGKGAKITAIVWDGRRLVVLDGRAKALLAIDGDGVPRPIVETGFDRPEAIAADPSGRLAVLDAKAAAVVFFSEDGRQIDRFSYRAAGIERPEAIAYGPDGVLHVFDGSTSSWVRVQ